MDKIEGKSKETEKQRKEEKEESKKAVEEMVMKMLESWKRKENITEWQEEKKEAEGMKK